MITTNYITRMLQPSASACFGSLCAMAVSFVPSLVLAQEPAVSEADQRLVCASSFEQSQVLRKAGRLRESRGELLKCVQSSCSRPVQEQCGVWLGDVERSLPSVVIQATVDGEDHSEVQVQVDGVPLVDFSPGKAISLDPGAHTFRIACKDFAGVEKKVIVREGEQLRPLIVAFNSPQPVDKKATATGPARPARPVPTHRPVPVLTYVLGGFAIAGGGAYGFLAYTSQKREEDLDKYCSPDCLDEDLDTLRQRKLAANITLGVSLAAAAGAVVSYLARPSKTDDSALTGGIAVTHEGVAASARLRF